MALNALIQQRRDERQAARAARIANRPVAQQATTTAAPATTNIMPANPGGTALNALWNSDVYQFPVQQGLNAINSNYAGRGMLESGAAMKGIADYIAGVAAPGAFNAYMGYLGDQQSMGYGAALGQTGVGQNYGSALTGLGTNYANSLSAINANLANAQSGAAQNIGNAYGNQSMLNAYNTNSMIGGIGQAAGNIAGYYSYQPYSGVQSAVSNAVSPAVSAYRSYL